MSDQQPPVRVVQCPKCGSPVEAGKPGAITSCSYCGSPLQLSVGASGHPIARLANIETSTVYLARAEQVRRVRQQVADAGLRLSAIREGHDAKQREIKEQRTLGSLRLRLLGGTVLVAFSLMTLCRQLSAFGFSYLLVGLVIVGVALWDLRQVKTKTDQVEQELAELIERGQQVCAERDRLAARVAELEAGLDELADQL